MSGVLIDYPALAALASRAFGYGAERTEAGRILAELEAERALADDLFAVLEMGCDNAERLRVMARYREARQQ